MSKPLHRLFGFIMLISFLYVQVPFAAFHHHDHKPVCELNDLTNSHKPLNDTDKHFHGSTNAPCFLCSAQLIKEYQVKDNIVSFTFSFISTPYCKFKPQLFSSFHFSFSARGPPVLA